MKFQLFYIAFGFFALAKACPPTVYYSPGTNCPSGSFCPTGTACYASNAACTTSGASCSTPVTFPVCTVKSKGGATVATNINYCVTSATCTDIGGAPASPAVSASSFDTCCTTANLGTANITYETYSLSATRFVGVCVGLADLTAYKVCKRTGQTNSYCLRFPNSCEASDVVETTSTQLITGTTFGAATYATCCRLLNTGAVGTALLVTSNAANTGYPFANLNMDRCSINAL